MKNSLLILSILLAACSGSEMDRMGGLSYALEGQGCEAPEGDYLLLHTNVRTESDSVVLDTRKIGRHLEVKLSSMDQASSLYKLFSKLCPEDSLHLEVNADSFYLALGGKVPDQLKEQVLQVDVRPSARLDEIKYQINKQLFERKAMKRYIEHYGWNATYDSATGIYYERMSVARTQSRPFSKAYVNYLIKTLSDRPVAYTKDGEPWVFDKSDEGMIAGLRFVGGLLKEQEQIRALIPSSMAFGSQGKEPVGAFQPIILEMEMVEIIE